MITTRIQIESYLAEYVRGKYYDETVGTVRFPSSSDIYVTVYDLMEKRPVNCPADRGNLEFMLPDRREANFAGGKSPEQFNYISVRGTAILEKRLRALMWAELHELMDENKHLHGIEFKETVFTFLKKYDISSIQEELERLGVRGAVVEAVDHGALDCTIRARLITAVKRASVSANEGGIA